MGDSKKPRLGEDDEQIAIPNGTIKAGRCSRRRLRDGKEQWMLRIAVAEGEKRRRGGIVSELHNGSERGRTPISAVRAKPHKSP